MSCIIKKSCCRHFSGKKKPLQFLLYERKMKVDDRKCHFEQSDNKIHYSIRWNMRTCRIQTRRTNELSELRTHQITN